LRDITPGGPAGLIFGGGISIILIEKIRIRPKE
jgi:hypothetical protein